MAVTLEKQELRVYEIRKKKHRRRVMIITIAVLLVLITVVVSAIFMIFNRNYTNYTVTQSIERKDSTSATYYPYEDGIIRLSRDGILGMDHSGNQLFNGVFQMKNPAIDISGDYVVVYDRGNKGLELVTKSGKVTTFNIRKPIMKAEVANQGVVAALLDGGDENDLNIYNSEGGLLFESRTLTETDGYPVDFALSSDGKKIVSSYVTLNDGNIQCQVIFQNFSKFGEDYTSNIVGAEDFGQTLVGDVEFINNDTVCVFGDDRIQIYKMEKIPELIHKEIFNKEIKSVYYNKEYIGVSFLNNSGDSKYELVVYDLEGNKVFSKNTNLEYKNIQISGEEIILNSDTEWYIFTMNGKKKFYYNFNQSISNVFPGNGLNRYIIVNSNAIENVKLKVK